MKKNILNKIDIYSEAIASKIPDQKELIQFYKNMLKENYQDILKFIQNVDISFNENDYKEFKTKYDSFERDLNKIEDFIQN